MSIPGNTILEREKNLMIQRDFSIMPYESVPNALKDASYQFPDAEEPAMVVSKNGKLFTLNLTAAFIFDLIDGQKTLSDIMQQFDNVFEASDESRNDIFEFLDNSISEGLIRQVN